VSHRWQHTNSRLLNWRPCRRSTIVFVVLYPLRLHLQHFSLSISTVFSVLVEISLSWCCCVNSLQWKQKNIFSTVSIFIYLLCSLVH
jgi:hypothetical protein